MPAYQPPPNPPPEKPPPKLEPPPQAERPLELVRGAETKVRFIPAHLTADEEEQVLFEEVSGDIAFALRNIELEEELQRKGRVGNG